MVRAVAGSTITDLIEDTKPGDSISMDIESSGRRTITRNLLLPMWDTDKYPEMEQAKAAGEPPTNFDKLNILLEEMKPSSNPGGFLLPGRFPLAGSLLFVDTVSVSPYGVEVEDCLGDLTIHWLYRLVTTYAPLPFDQPQENPSDEEDALALLERQDEVGGTALTVPGYRLYWETDNDPISDEHVNAAITLDVINYNYTKHYISDSQADTLLEKARDLAGKVNEAAFATDRLFKNVKAETLLFNGASRNEVFNSDGTRRNVVTFSLQERVGKTRIGTTLTWNHLYNPVLGIFDKVYRESAAAAGGQVTGLYDTATNAEFIDLFRV